MFLAFVPRSQYWSVLNFMDALSNFFLVIHWKMDSKISSPTQGVPFIFLFLVSTRCFHLCDNNTDGGLNSYMAKTGIEKH